MILSASCNRSESTEGLGPASSTGSAKPGSGGFSADLAKDLAGSKPAEPTGVGSGSADPKTGDKPADSKPEASASGDAKSAAATDSKPAASDSKAADSKVAGSDSKPFHHLVFSDC